MAAANSEEKVLTDTQLLQCSKRTEFSRGLYDMHKPVTPLKEGGEVECSPRPEQGIYSTDRLFSTIHFIL